MPRGIPVAEHGGLHKSQGRAGEEQCFPSQDRNPSEFRGGNGAGVEVKGMQGLVALR